MLPHWEAAPYFDFSYGMPWSCHPCGSFSMLPHWEAAPYFDFFLWDAMIMPPISFVWTKETGGAERKTTSHVTQPKKSIRIGGF